MKHFYKIHAKPNVLDTKRSDYLATLQIVNCIDIIKNFIFFPLDSFSRKLDEIAEILSKKYLP